MERIEQALRKAREQRQAAGIAEPASTALPNSVRPASLSYTQTLVVPLQPALLERNRVIAVSLTHPVTDVYRALRAQLLQALSKLGCTTLGITSAGPGEGKTLTAVNLAIATAMDANHTVLLVDADLRNPGVAKCLGIEPKLGLDDYLAGRASIAECLVNAGLERLTILPARGLVGNSAELLASPQMAQLARELKRYPDRIILYDLPPLLTAGDTLGFLPSLEATLLVVRDGAARAADLKRAVDLLGGHNLIGTVLNAAE
jgi:capsular exopolysaccharide synthesis family protein